MKEVIKTKIDFHRTILIGAGIVVSLGGLLGDFFNFRGARDYLIGIFVMGFLIVFVCSFYRFNKLHKRLHSILMGEKNRLK